MHHEKETSNDPHVIIQKGGGGGHRMLHSAVIKRDRRLNAGHVVIQAHHKGASYLDINGDDRMMKDYPCPKLANSQWRAANVIVTTC